MEYPAIKLKKWFPEERGKVLESLISPLVLSEENLQKIVSALEENMQWASSKDEATRKKTHILMENTYIRKFLDGTENGDYLGLDVGGTSFRIVRVNFKDGQAETSTKYYEMPADLLTGPSIRVFEHMAQSVEDFVEMENLKGKKIPLGFTFSFPSIKKSLTSAEIITWTKTFKCTDGPGMDPAQALMDAMAKRNLSIDLVAIVSDTTATLMAGNYMDDKCRIGLILGTGCNSCYLEDIDKIEKWEPDSSESRQVIINVEWGCLSDNGSLDFIKTEYDKQLDLLSNHVHSFTFEKFSSGHYLGELVRQVLIQLTTKKIIFEGKGSEKLFTPWMLKTALVTSIEKDHGDTSNTWLILKEFGLESVASEGDVALVKEVCMIVSQRGAYIIAAALSALLRRINLPEVTIAVDGSLYEHHPKYHDHLVHMVSMLVPQTKTRIILAKDGSGQGSAFAAAAVQKQVQVVQN